MFGVEQLFEEMTQEIARKQQPDRCEMTDHTDILLRSPFPGLTTHPKWWHRVFATLGDACGLAVIVGLALAVYHLPEITNAIGY